MSLQESAVIERRLSPLLLRKQCRLGSTPADWVRVATLRACILTAHDPGYRSRLTTWAWCVRIPIHHGRCDNTHT